MEKDGTRTRDPALGILIVSRAGGMWCCPTRAVLPGASSSRDAFFIRLFELAPGHLVHIPASSAGRPGGLSEAQRPRVFSWAAGTSCALCISGSADLDQTLSHHIFSDPRPCRETPKCTESRAQSVSEGAALAPTSKAPSVPRRTCGCRRRSRQFLGGCSGVSAIWPPLFPGMSDFQYLAVHTDEGGRHMSMYDKVLMLKPEKESFFHQELPLYIPPPIFSRLDTPVDYFYRPETQHR